MGNMKKVFLGAMLSAVMMSAVAVHAEPLWKLIFAPNPPEVVEENTIYMGEMPGETNARLWAQFYAKYGDLIDQGY
jgi:hypothetical protein